MTTPPPKFVQQLEFLRDVSENEVVIVFNSDDEGVDFQDWLEDEGFDLWRVARGR